MLTMLKTLLLIALAVEYVVEGAEERIDEEKRAIDFKQLKSLKRLLKDLNSGFLATCRIVFFKELVRYETAERECTNFHIGSGRAEKGNLVTVNNEEKNRDLTLLLEMAYPEKKQPKSKWTATKWVWAGLRKIHNNKWKFKKGRKAKKRAVYVASDWAWADGSNLTDFQMWPTKKKNRQPDQAMLKYRQKSGKETCDEKPLCRQNQMRINHKGSWDDAYKFKTHPYACDYKGKYILSNDRLTWVKAKEACDNAGLHLAKVRSKREIEEMKDAIVHFLGEADPSWMTWDARNWVWLGGNDINEEKKWEWLDGTPADDWNVPWRRKAGKDNASYLRNHDGQDAMAFSRWGEFDDSYIRKRKRPFACQCPDS